MSHAGSPRRSSWGVRTSTASRRPTSRRPTPPRRRRERPPGSAERRHHLAGEELHRAQHARVREIAEPEAAVEVRDAHELPDALDLTDARVRRPDDQEAVQEVVEVGLLGRRHRDGAASLHALVVVAQAERHPHVPAGLLGGGPRVGLAVCHIDRSLHADLQRARTSDLGHHAVEEPAELGHALDGDAEAAREHMEPAAHGPLHRFRALRRDPDGRKRFLDGLREHRRLRDLEELPLVAERLAAERLQDDVDRLLPPRAAALQLEAEPLELVALVAAAEPDVEAPAAEQVERRDLLGDHQRVVERHHDDGRAHSQPGGLRRDVRRELGGAREIAVGREVMLGEPDVAEPERLGRLGHLDPARIDLLRGARGRRLHEQERPEVHIRTLLRRRGPRQVARRARLGADQETSTRRIPMARLTPITGKDQVAPKDRAVVDAIVASRGALQGPFTMFLHCPELAGRVAHLGAFIRFEGSLDKRVRVLTAMTVARELDAVYIWGAQIDGGRRLGMPESTIAAIREQHDRGLPPEDAQIVDFTRQLIRNHRVDDATVKALRARFGSEGLIQLTGTIRYYSMLAIAVNACELEAGPGAEVLP